jgi:cob(I)alamin adenosyltransferase
VRITKVYTKQGDGGQTRLGGGQKLDKDSIRITAFGTVDELNSCIGVALAFDPDSKVSGILTKIQHELFVLGGDLCILESDKKATNMQGITRKHTAALELVIDELNTELKPLEEFILPGGTRISAFLHHARCVCRRAEREVVALSHSEETGPQVIPYLNRLSDTLFVLARYQNAKSGVPDVYWKR